MVRWRIPGWTYAYSFLLPPTAMLLALVIARGLAGGPVLPPAMPIHVPVLVFLYVLGFSVLGEELGWRGLARPILLRSQGLVPASLILGAFWVVWHAPLFAVPEACSRAFQRGSSRCR
jgi:membrane protease YdiL (CAAX protease family)